VLAKTRMLVCRALAYNEFIPLSWDTITSARSQEFSDMFPQFRGCLRKLEWTDFTSPPTWVCFTKNSSTIAADRANTTCLIADSLLGAL
jgi:hypothetical protein